MRLRERIDATDWTDAGVDLFGDLLATTQASDEAECIVMVLAAWLILRRSDTPGDICEQMGEFMELCLELRGEGVAKAHPSLRVVGGRDAP